MQQFPIGMDKDQKWVEFLLRMANRHGLIAGATGTGKTVTLQTIAENFSKANVPIFTADVKGDLAGLAFPGVDNPKTEQRVRELKMKDYTHEGSPVVFWDIYAKFGHPLRTTVSEMGPLLFGHILDINETQQGIINAAFSYADDHGLLLLDLKDIRSMLNWMKDNPTEFQGKYGNITASSVGAIQRSLLSLEEAGGNLFFGEPAFKIDNLFQHHKDGRGIINILDATQLINNGLLYSTFLLWLLSELFETLPEVGDLDKPKLVFIFDEAHLLFYAAPKLLLEKIIQLVRLIRSKGVGVYFVTQNPVDIPDTVLGQLGNRVQHALRGFTPKDQKAIKAAAQTFRQNSKINTEKVISELEVGEALVSLLDENGAPTVVDKVKIAPPASRIGAITESERQMIIGQSPYNGIYEKTIDRESAYEILQKKIQSAQQTEKETETVMTETPTARGQGRPRQSTTETFLKSTARTVGSQMGRQIVRGILGSIFGKSK